jgi:hypothetical protein
MKFELRGEITGVETIASGSGIRELARLNRTYGRAHWRKRKGTPMVRLSDGSTQMAELHWCGASAFGRKELKIKNIF